MLGAVFFFVPAPLLATEKTAGPPNIIYINVDDLGWKDLAYQGSTFYETPNIDRLASASMNFTNAYAPAANCSPSRASSLTGMYPPRHGIYTVGSSERGEAEDRKLIPIKNTQFIKQGEQTIASILKAAGYKTAAIGKWHIGSDPLKNGFDVNIAGNDWGGPYSQGGYHSPYAYPNCIREKKGEYLTDRLTEEAIGFIGQNTGTPFFLYLSYYTVHAPLQAKPEKRESFARKQSNKAHNNPIYAAMIESLDEGIGRLTEALGALRLAEKTLVVFTSDNGGVWKTSKQWPLRAGKGAYYEGGIRVPMLAHWPGVIKEGSSSDTPVSAIDLFPTFLEAAGMVKPENKLLDGVSLMPILTQRGAVNDRALFWHFPIYLENGNPETRDPKFRTRPGSVIRLGDWKLHEYFEDGSLELYNLTNDIGEKLNLAGNRPDKVKELYELLKAWRKSTRAPVPTKLNPQYTQ